MNQSQVRNESQQNRRKIRLVFYGDAPSVATGFGKVSSNILPNLYASGDYEIYCFGVNYMGVPHPYPFQIYPMLPNPQGDPYGREKICQILPQMDFDIVFFLQDSFILRDVIPRVVQEMRSKGKKFRSVVYFPIDGEPWSEWVEAMYAADVSITYTNWARKQCINKYPEIANKLRVIPHGISLKEFFPHPPEKRKQLRKLFFGPHADKFIVINVNRNQQRKDLPRTLLAFREFKKECPNSVYYLHCAVKDVGWDLERVVKNMNMRLDEDVLFPRNFNVNTGVPVSVVNDLYNCADVCISATLGGGWELSSVESGATKVPCIFPDNTALTEIFADGRGFLCRSGDGPNFKVVLPMDNEIVRPLMNITDMVKYLKRLYEKPEIGRVMSEKFYRWVVDNLQWEKHIVPQFDAIFKDLFADLIKPEEAVKDNIMTPLASSGWQVGEIV